MASKAVRRAQQKPKAKKKIAKMDHGKRSKQKLAKTKAKPIQKQDTVDLIEEEFVEASMDNEAGDGLDEPIFEEEE